MGTSDSDPASGVVFSELVFDWGSETEADADESRSGASPSLEQTCTQGGSGVGRGFVAMLHAVEISSSKSKILLMISTSGALLTCASMSTDGTLLTGEPMSSGESLRISVLTLGSIVDALSETVITKSCSSLVGEVKVNIN